MNLLAIALSSPGTAWGQIAIVVAFLLAVALVAITWGRGPALVTALASAIVYNYLFSPPAYAFTAPTSEEAFLLLGLLAIAVCLGTLADRMRAAKEEVEGWDETDRLQRTLLASISRDLRTPLIAIMGSLSTLLRAGRQLEERSKEDLVTTAYEEAKQLDRLVAQILEITRLETGMVRVRRELGNIVDVIGTAFTQMHPALQGRSHRIEVPPELPLVPMDAVLLSHVLVNVLDNAAKYSPPEFPIEVGAQHTEGWITISVADRGVGIPSAELDHVFEKFHRIRPLSATGSAAGIGLGLAIAKEIVEAHEGQIWAEQRDGGGTVVKVRLPLH